MQANMEKGQQLPGSHLLAALHSRMERIKGVVRVCKAASKKPHSRSNTDINLIAAETQSVTLLAREGPAVHRELCHVLQALSVSQMQSVWLPGKYKSGILVYVLQGRVQIRTRSKAAFEHGLECSVSSSAGSPGINSTGSPGARSTCSSSSSSPGGSNGGKKVPAGAAVPASVDGTNAGAGGASAASASEADLRALFDSIDKDGSGAIDVEELQYALSVMGIDKSPAEVQELMDSVDKDGSGQLEFEEFVLILTTKLGVGGGQRESAWQELPDGSWSMEVEQGGCFGEAALLKGLAQEGLLLALEDCSLLTLDAASYTSILTHGFDGQLNAKLAILKSSSLLASCISNRSDMRGLAYATASEGVGWAGQLYGAGQAAAALYVIQEGNCRIITKSKAAGSATAAATSSRALSPPKTTSSSMEASTDGSNSVMQAMGSSAGGSSAAAAAALLSSPRHGLHSPHSRLVERRVEVALLGPGDIAGEASALGLACHSSSAVVCSAHMLVLRLDLQDLKQLLHPADMQHLAELLQLREEERQQRLQAAAATTSAVLQQQLHVKAAAMSASGAAAGPGTAWEAGADETGVLHTNAGSSPTAVGSSPKGGRQGAAASSGSAAKQGAPQLPLSKAASVAAAIAAAGGSPRKDLPSRIEREKVTAVQQLLERLTASSEDMENCQSLAMSAAVAALAAAQAEVPGSSGSGSRRVTCPSSQLASAAAATAAALSAQHDAVQPSSCLRGSSGACGVTGKHTAGSGSSSSSTRLEPARRTCSPPSCRHSSQPTQQQRMTAAELLLPPSLQHKLEAVLHRAHACAGSNSSTPRTCSKIHKHRQSTSYAAAGICCSSSGAGSSGGGKDTNRQSGSSTAGVTHVPNSPRLAADSEPGTRHSSRGSLTARAFHSANGGSGRSGEGHLQCYTSRQIHSSSGCGKLPAAASRVSWLGDAQHLPAAGDYTSNGSGAVLQHGMCGSGSGNVGQQCCSCCSAGAGAGAASSSGGPAAAESAAVVGVLQHQQAVAHSGAVHARQVSSPRSSRVPQSAPNIVKPSSPGPGSPRLQPLCVLTAPMGESGGCAMQVQGLSASGAGCHAASSHSQRHGCLAAAATEQHNADDAASSSEAAYGVDAELTFNSSRAGQLQQQALCQPGAMQPALALSCPAVDGFFLTETTAAAAMPPVSPEAAAAVSAAVTAAEAMRASNSIDLCLSRAVTPRTSRSVHSPRTSLGIVSVELAAGSTAAACAGSALGSRLSTPRSPTAAAAAAGVLRSSRAVSAAAALQPATAGTCSARCSIATAAPATNWPGAAAAAAAVAAASAAAAAAAAAAGDQQNVVMPTPRSSHSRQVPVRVFSAVDASVWQAAEAAAGATSWSLGVRLLQSPRAAVDAPQLQQDLQAQQAAAGSLTVASKSSNSSSSSNVKPEHAADAQQQQQQQQQQQHKQQQAAHAKPAAAAVPHLQLQKLRNMDLGLVDSSDSQSSKCSSRHNSVAQGSRSGALSATAAQQQQQQHTLTQSAAGSTAVTTQAGVAPLPSWRSALTTRWQLGGRFKQEHTHASQSRQLQGSQSSRL